MTTPRPLDHHASLLPSLAHSSRCRHAASSKESILDATFLTAVELITTAEHALQAVTPAPLQSSSSLQWCIAPPQSQPTHGLMQATYALVHIRHFSLGTQTTLLRAPHAHGAQTTPCPDRHMVQTTLDLPGDTRPLAHCDRTTSGRSSSPGST
jgi:hypothetical protein